VSRSLTRHQHIDGHRKFLLRKHLLKWASPGPAFVPFVGDGDICVGGSKPDALKHEQYRCPGVYLDRFVFGADIDESRVKVARSRIANGTVLVADCDVYPFKGVETGKIAVADFDAWAEPYPAFRSFWANAEKADRVVAIFTDAHRMGIAVDGTLLAPDGSKTTFRPVVDLHARQRAFNFYLSRIVWPWFEGFIEPYRVLYRMRYLRGMLTYWGAAVER
jgi:hypothetical protein